MEAVFEEPDLFQARYQRNNKRGGLKNLRCFPTCAALHRERGFCGRMVVLRVSSPASNLIVYGEFLPVSDKDVGLKIDDVVTRDRAKEICRDKSNPTKPWMEGEIIEEGSGYSRFAFNRDKKGWHYGWASNKHTCNASHALQAYVMEEMEPNKLVVKGVFQSPQFTLFCRRRRRFAMVPSAPIAPPSSKKRSGGKGGDAKGKESGEEDDEDGDDDDEDEEDEPSDDEAPGKTTARPLETKVATSTEKKPKAVRSIKRTRESKPKEMKRAKILVVEEAKQQVRDKSALDRYRLVRVERMLREISKRTSSRSKPLIISRSNSPELFSATDSASTSTGEEHQLTQAQFASHLFECIDFFAGDSLLDDPLLEGDFLDDVPISEAAIEDERMQLIDDLASYLLDERGFTDAVHALSKAARASKTSLETDQVAFDSFILILESYLETFLSTRGLALSKFDEMFAQEAPAPFQTGGEILARTAFKHIMESAEGMFGNTDEDDRQASPSPALLDISGVDRMNGTWILAQNSSSPGAASPTPISLQGADDGIESIRESLGYPWVLRKMLSFMEQKFSVALSGNVLTVKLQRKLFASGSMTIILDGEEHDWGMKLPMFEGIASVWKYRAWVNEGIVHHVHETGDGINSRMKRSMWVDDDDMFNLDVSLEEFNSEQGRWDTVAHALQRATRCG